MPDDLLMRIEESMPTLSKSQRAIGRYICEHYDKAAYMTAAKLGALVGVSDRPLSDSLPNWAATGIRNCSRRCVSLYVPSHRHTAG